MTSAELVRTARKLARVSQLELARRTGITQNYISRIERGRVNPTVKTLQRIAHALNVPVTELIPEE